jgi:hypothetical protein
MIADEPAIACALYAAAPSCPDLTCACHVPEQQATA